MRLRQLSDLQSDLQYRADVLGGLQAYPLTLQTELLNQGWARVYGLLTESGEPYYLTPFAFSTVVGQDTLYTTAATGVPAGTNVLPTDLYKLTGLDMQVDPTPRYRPCRRYQFEQRDDYPPGSYSAGDLFSPSTPGYDYQGSGATAAVRMIRLPASATPMRLWYYPAAIRLVNPGDTIDGGNGWEVYAIDWAAKRVAEMDANYELADRIAPALSEMELRIKAEAANRNAGQAKKVRRTRYRDGRGGGHVGGFR